MLIWYILATGIVVGLLPGILGFDRTFSVANILVATLGALVGAFVGFGDAPMFLEYPLLNERTLMVAAAILLVLLKVTITRKKRMP